MAQPRINPRLALNVSVFIATAQRQCSLKWQLRQLPVADSWQTVLGIGRVRRCYGANCGINVLYSYYLATEAVSLFERLKVTHPAGPGRLKGPVATGFVHRVTKRDMNPNKCVDKEYTGSFGPLNSCWLAKLACKCK